MMGNATLDQSADNALMALELTGCDAPVYKGASKTLNGQEKEVSHVFGSDGMGEMDLVHPSRSPEQKDAVDFIIDSVRENPGGIEIVTLVSDVDRKNGFDRYLEAIK